MLRRLNDGAVIDVDNDALNPDGTLREGGTLRVPLMFRDSNREIAGQRARPALRFADGRTDMPIGSRPGFVTDAGVGQEIRDRAYRDSVEALRTAWRAGAVDATPIPSAAPMSAADAARTDMRTLMARLDDARRSAYEAHVHELTNAWRTPA
jgi:hypothetical protein